MEQPILNNDEQYNAAIDAINNIVFIVSRYANLVNKYLIKKDKNLEKSNGYIIVASYFDNNYSTTIRELYYLILTY